MNNEKHCLCSHNVRSIDACSMYTCCCRTDCAVSASLWCWTVSFNSRIAYTVQCAAVAVWILGITTNIIERFLYHIFALFGLYRIALFLCFFNAFLKIILYQIRPKMLFLLKIFFLFFNSLHFDVIFSMIFKYFQSTQYVLWIAQNVTWFFNSYRSLHCSVGFCNFYSLKILWILLDFYRSAPKFDKILLFLYQFAQNYF